MYQTSLSSASKKYSEAGTERESFKWETYIANTKHWRQY
jgi:hypothetical protein